MLQINKYMYKKRGTYNSATIEMTRKTAQLHSLLEQTVQSLEPLLPLFPEKIYIEHNRINLRMPGGAHYLIGSQTVLCQ